MDIVVQVAIISAAASIIVGILTFVLNKRAERKDALQKCKLEHYKEILTAISELAISGTDKDAAKIKFAHASNTISLVAPQSVIKALMDFHDELKHSNSQRTVEGSEQKLKRLLLELRKSLELPYKDTPSTFCFHLIGSSPQESKPVATRAT